MANETSPSLIEQLLADFTLTGPRTVRLITGSPPAPIKMPAIPVNPDEGIPFPGIGDAMTCAVLREEIRLQQRIIWLLLTRLGGEVTVTDTEIAGLPGVVPITTARADTDLGIRIIAEPHSD